MRLLKEEVEEEEEVEWDEEKRPREDAEQMKYPTTIPRMAVATPMVAEDGGGRSDILR